MKAPADISRESLRSTVAEFICVEAEDIAASADFTEDLGLDSIDRLDLLATIEKKHGLHLSDEEVSSIACFDDLLKHVAAKHRFGW